MLACVCVIAYVCACVQSLCTETHIKTCAVSKCMPSPVRVHVWTAMFCEDFTTYETFVGSNPVTMCMMM